MRRMVCMRPAMRTRTSGRPALRRSWRRIRQDLRDGVGEIEALPVRPVTQRFDLADARQALLKQFVFQRQIQSPLGEISYYKSSLLTRSISIIIPAYNEEKRLPATLDDRSICYLRRGGWEFAEIVVVDDGSRDGTAEVAEALRTSIRSCACCAIRAIAARATPCGTACWNAEGEWALFTDADLSAPIEELEKLWQAAENAKARRWPSARGRSTGT